MNKRNLVIGAVVVVLVVAVSLFVAGRDGEDGKDGRNGRDGLGAVSTLDGVDNPYVSINGVRKYYQNDNIIATSSVLCSRRNPFGSATSTVEYLKFQFTNGMTGDQNLSVSTSSTQYGTSSPAIVYDRSVLSEAQDTLVWYPNSTTTPVGNTRLLNGANADGSSTFVVGPDEYLVYAVATSSAGVLDSNAVGSCKAIWSL